MSKNSPSRAVVLSAEQEAQLKEVFCVPEIENIWDATRAALVKTLKKYRKGNRFERLLEDLNQDWIKRVKANRKGKLMFLCECSCGCGYNYWSQAQKMDGAYVKPLHPQCGNEEGGTAGQGRDNINTGGWRYNG